MKKLYYLADVLTLGEVIAGVILLGMAIFRTPADYGIWVFVAGELCDAFDGVCARRWPYPNDGKTRWWRTYVTQIEHLSDIFIAVACMIYLMRNQQSNIASGAILLGATIIVVCTCAEIMIRIYSSPKMPLQTMQLTKCIILVRRWIYAFVGIGGGIYLLIMATSWDLSIKLYAIAIGIFCGAFLLIYKLDRALKP